MGYYDAAELKDTDLWSSPSATRSLDNFFMGAFGGSFLNHIWLVCACAPEWPDPPKSQRSRGRLQAGHALQDKACRGPGDGDYAVNTTQSIF